MASFPLLAVSRGICATVDGGGLVSSNILQVTHVPIEI